MVMSGRRGDMRSNWEKRRQIRPSPTDYRRTLSGLGAGVGNEANSF
jgi:hypothetical protein